MRIGLLATVCASGLVAGCGNAEEAFNKQFDESFVSSCVSSAVQGGVPAQIADQACGCALTGINEKFSAAEKMTISEEQAGPIMQACLEQTVEPNG
jgi:hypothetical protein